MTLDADFVLMDKPQADAHELEVAGRRADAQLLAQLAAAVAPEVTPALPPEELDRRLEEAVADIAAGRLTPDEKVWAQIDHARGRAALPS